MGGLQPKFWAKITNLRAFDSLKPVKNYPNRSEIFPQFCIYLNIQNQTPIAWFIAYPTFPFFLLRPMHELDIWECSSICDQMVHQKWKNIDPLSIRKTMRVYFFPLFARTHLLVTNNNLSSLSVNFMCNLKKIISGAGKWTTKYF